MNQSSNLKLIYTYLHNFHEVFKILKLKLSILNFLLQNNYLFNTHHRNYKEYQTN